MRVTVYFKDIPFIQVRCQRRVSNQNVGDSDTNFTRVREPQKVIIGSELFALYVGCVNGIGVVNGRDRYLTTTTTSTNQ